MQFLKRPLEAGLRHLWVGFGQSSYSFVSRNVFFCSGSWSAPADSLQLGTSAGRARIRSRPPYAARFLQGIRSRPARKLSQPTKDSEQLQTESQNDPSAETLSAHHGMMNTTLRNDAYHACITKDRQFKRGKGTKCSCVTRPLRR